MTFLEKVRQIAKYLSVIVAICGALTLVTMQVRAFRVDAQISRGAIHTTQDEDAAFHREFWSKFEVGAKVLFAGCLALSLTVTSKRAFKTGWRMLALSAILLFGSCTMIRGVHAGYSGATAISIVTTVFCAGAGLLIVGGLKFGYTKLRSHSG